MQWIEISIAAHPEAVEVLSENLMDATGHGVAIIEPYTLEDEGQRWHTSAGEPVVVHAYLPQDEQSTAILQRIAEICWHLKMIGEVFIGEMKTRNIDDDDWAETWKEYFHVLRVGRRIVIKPSWRAYPDAGEDEAIIELDPGMAFGTGTHPTTRLCLQALEDVIQPGDSLLDVGTGSGILAIGAVKLGAATAVAVDVSTVAVRVASENVALNHVADRIAVTQGTLGIGPESEPLLLPAAPNRGEDAVNMLAGIRALTPAHVVVANIIARVIGELAPALLAATAPGGTLITSGIIAEREHEAFEPLRAAGLVAIERRQEGDWIALIGKRPR